MAPRLLRRDQALAAGFTATQIDQCVRLGRWTRVLPQIYWTGAMSTDPDRVAALRIRAASIWSENAVIGGITASWWRGWTAVVPQTIELRIGLAKQLSRQPGFCLHRCELHESDVVEYRGVRSTTAARTALDLAAQGNTDLLDLMLRKNWFDVVALEQALARGAGQRGWATARQALLECGTRPFSAAERVLHRALLAAGIEGWVANHRLVIRGATCVPDVLFEQQRLVVEIDGHEHHSSRAAFERDRARQNLLVAAGYRVLQFTWQQLVDHPDAAVRAVQAELDVAASLEC